MTFVKIAKNKAYFKRYQTKYRRRREAKTDYQARKGLIMQDLNKFLVPKYRLVVRITNSRVIAQIVYATYEGDRVLNQADSTELKKYGLTTGLTSYSAAYATGLLLARRTLTELKMADKYKGATEINGADYNVEAHADEERRPFIAVLDIGLRRPTTGNRVFGCMKGACDGGINVPHSTKRFAAFAEGSKQFNAEAHRDRIFGAHIDDYMEHLKDDETAKKKQFGLWGEVLKKAGVGKVEDLFKKVFDGIRADPLRAKKDKKEAKVEFKDDKKTQIVSKKAKKGFYTRDRQIGIDERKKRVADKIAKAKKALGK